LLRPAGDFHEQLRIEGRLEQGRLVLFSQSSHARIGCAPDDLQQFLSFRAHQEMLAHRVEAAKNYL
jgi:hypothetical protein